jgi:hypothetical protein
MKEIDSTAKLPDMKLTVYGGTKLITMNVKRTQNQSKKHPKSKQV